MQIEENLYDLAMEYWQLQTLGYDIEYQYPELLDFEFTGPDLAEKLETVINHCKEIQANEKPPPEPYSDLIFHDDIAPLPNNSVVNVAARAIMSGGEGFAHKADGWRLRGDGLEYKVPFPKAGMILITLEDREPAALVQSFNVFTLDVLVAVLGQVCFTYCKNRTSNPLIQRSTITARQILRYKGTRSYGAKRWALIEKVNEEMIKLGKLRIDVRRNTTKNPENYKGSLLILEPVKRDFNKFTQQYTVTSWRVQPGKWAAYDMSQDRYEFIGKLNHRILRYDHRQQRSAQAFAKKLMYVLFTAPGGTHYLIQGAKKSLAGYLKLIGEYYETDDGHRKLRSRNLQRLGEAIDFLVGQGMITTSMPGGVTDYIKGRSRPWHLQHTLGTVIEVKLADCL